MTDSFTPENGQPEQPQYNAPQYQPQQYNAQYDAPQTLQPQYQQPQYQYEQPQYGQPQYGQPQYQQAQPICEAPSPVQVLVFGIISLATAVSFYLSIVGFIFGILGKRKAEDYMRSGAAPSTQVTVGGRLAKAGFIVGLIMSILFTFFVIALLFA